MTDIKKKTKKGYELNTWYYSKQEILEVQIEHIYYFEKKEETPQGIVYFGKFVESATDILNKKHKLTIDEESIIADSTLNKENLDECKCPLELFDFIMDDYYDRWFGA